MLLNTKIRVQTSQCTVTVLVLPERKGPTQILVVNAKGCVFGHMWGKDGAVRAHQTVALFGCPVRQMCPSVEGVDQTVLGDIARSSEYRYNILGSSVFLHGQSENHTISH